MPELIGMEEQLHRRAGQLQSSWGGSCQGYESNKTGGRPSLCHSLGNVALIQPIWREVENLESTKILILFETRRSFTGNAHWPLHLPEGYPEESFSKMLKELDGVSFLQKLSKSLKAVLYFSVLGKKGI